MAVTRETFRNALGRLAAGVSLIATEHDGERRGITATAICSVCDDPATVLACVNTATGTAKMIEARGWFSINFLAETQQPIAEIFAGKGGVAGEDRFRHGRWARGRSGLPVLQDALATLECKVEKAIRSGTHIVFFATVEAVGLEAVRPLMYHAGKFQRLPADPQGTRNPAQESAEALAGA